MTFESTNGHSLQQGSSTGGPGPLGGPQSYCRGVAKSLCDRIILLNEGLVPSHPYSEENQKYQIYKLVDRLFLANRFGVEVKKKEQTKYRVKGQVY